MMLILLLYALFLSALLLFLSPSRFPRTVCHHLDIPLPTSLVLTACLSYLPPHIALAIYSIAQTAILISFSSSLHFLHATRLDFLAVPTSFPTCVTQFPMSRAFPILILLFTRCFYSHSSSHTTFDSEKYATAFILLLCSIPNCHYEYHFTCVHLFYCLPSIALLDSLLLSELYPLYLLHVLRDFSWAYPPGSCPLGHLVSGIQ